MDDQALTPVVLSARDDSGTPVALLTMAWRQGRLELLDRVHQDEVVVEFPFGPIPREQTGYTRFVQLRSLKFALVA